MAKKNQQLVLAFFDTETAADAAVEALKQWDKATDSIKLGAIGVLVKDAKGNIKTNKLGSRKTGTGALIFGLVGLLSGGMTVVGGLIFGAIAGSLFHKGLGMSKDDLARVGKNSMAVRRAWRLWLTPTRPRPCLPNWWNWAAHRRPTK